MCLWLVLRCFITLFFFFSSRRRHTRCYRDWSSDVCSSDLRSPCLDKGYPGVAIFCPGRAIFWPGGAKRNPTPAKGCPGMAIFCPGRAIFWPGRSEERRVGKECRCRRGREDVGQIMIVAVKE